MHIECVWWFSSSWRLRYWHPHQQHQLRAPRRQPTMAFFCHLETTMKLPWWSMMPYAWLLKSTRCVLQPCVGYQVICRRCCRKRSLDGSDSSKRTGVSGEDGFHVQCHLSTITILQGIVYVFCIFDDIRCPRCIRITYQDKSRMCQHDSTCLEYHMLNINGVTWDVEWWTTA